MAHADREPDLPESIGRFQVLGLLGDGAMGRVFEALQSEPERRVALKVIRAPLAGERAVRRFQNEARALACLSHAGIATVYETGTADLAGEACPYIAMELVEGLPLDAFLAQGSPSLRARIELLARICDAVQHAHHKGVVHRDLKPGNVMVDAEGRPKVLDFGLAHSGGNVDATLTSSGQWLGTLPYMSPEQFSGDPSRIGPRSDIYSLGVLLHEVIGGRRPFDVEGLSLAEAAGVVAEGRAPKLGDQDKRFRGDLETIVAKALESDPEQRYASAAQLAADLRRFLDYEPILARPTTSIYRFRMFARRNRWLVAGAASTVAALVMGLIGTGLFALSAGARATEAEQSRLEAAGFAAEMRAAEQSEREEAEAAIAAREEARRQERTAKTVQDLFLRVLNVARPARTQGREVTVLEALATASAEVEDAGFEDPATEYAIQQTLADVFGVLDSFDSAVAHSRLAIQLADEHFGTDSSEARAARSWLAELLGSIGQTAGSTEIRQEIVASSGLSTPGASIDIHAYKALGQLGVRERTLGNFARAVEMSERALVGLRGYATEDPIALLWELHHMSNHCMMTGDYERELATARESHELALEAGFENLTVPLDILAQLGNALDDNGHSAEAIELYQRTLELGEQWYGENDDVLMVRFNLALAQAQTGRTDEALRNLERAFAGLSDLFPADGHSVLLVVKGMLDVYGMAGRYEEGLIWMDTHAPVVPDDFDGALILIARGSLLFEVGAFEEAVDVSSAGYERASRSLPVGHPHRIDALRVLAAGSEELGRADDQARYAELIERHLSVVPSPE